MGWMDTFLEITKISCFLWRSRKSSIRCLRFMGKRIKRSSIWEMRFRVDITKRFFFGEVDKLVSNVYDFEKWDEKNYHLGNEVKI